MCTLIATDARAMNHAPPVFVYIIGETCLGIYTLELLVGCWADGLQHFKKPAIMFDTFTVLGLHQLKFCVSCPPLFFFNHFFPNRCSIGISLCCCLGLAVFFLEDSVGSCREMSGGSNFQFKVYDRKLALRILTSVDTLSR